MSYNHSEIEKKWQLKWQSSQAFCAAEVSSKPKYYALDMFPYPSGVGLHIGHMASYTPTDVVSRYKRARGYNVLHPMGYDAFGLPAEQYAIQTGIHPAETTKAAIENFRAQLKAFGFSFDWSREISTCEPSYYKWTQFIFLKLFEKGLAYQKEVPVNWCPALKTVLANEEVVDGKSERGDHPVIRVPMKQWMLKITAYAERLLNDLDKVDWPERSKEGQRNWIGKSVGAKILFKLQDHPHRLEVFTTRPDTLYGVTFMVISPEHPLIGQITHEDYMVDVQKYIQKSSRKSEVDRKAGTEKSGVFTGAYALHPLTALKIPIWTSDYVLMDYGSGAIMAVPAHDARDFEFAQTFKLPVQQVVEGGDMLPFEGDGMLCNSDFLNGLTKAPAIDKMIQHLEANGIGEKQVQYKLRDWLFSRQRYWGEPFPVVNFDGVLKGVPTAELPVTLPKVADYEPSEKGEAPLARNNEWVTYVDAQTGQTGRRETDTMPGSAGSSWYFLRYIDPHNDNEACSFEKQKHWMPVDLYVGGPEHTVGHLLYARFWQKVLFDAGLVSHDEPFQKLAHQGMILGPDGEKMSKSRGNVVNPDEMRERYGADALRLYILFLGPMDRDKPWAEHGIEGVQRFLDRLWRFTVQDGRSILNETPLSDELNRLMHKTIKKIQEDYEAMSFNTAISALMILLNEAYKTGERSKLLIKTLVQLLAPMAPHISEELWQILGEKDLVSLATWPEYDSDLTVDSVVTIGVQVNGKSRGEILIDKEASEEAAVAAAMQLAPVKNAVQDKPVTKVIYKAGRILNLIVKV